MCVFSTSVRAEGRGAAAEAQHCEKVRRSVERGAPRRPGQLTAGQRAERRGDRRRTDTDGKKGIHKDPAAAAAAA